jgi:hypothetical protein
LRLTNFCKKKMLNITCQREPRQARLRVSRLVFHSGVGSGVGSFVSLSHRKRSHSDLKPPQYIEFDAQNFHQSIRRRARVVNGYDSNNLSLSNALDIICLRARRVNLPLHHSLKILLTNPTVRILPASLPFCLFFAFMT